MKNVNNDTIYLDGNNYKMNMFYLGLEFSVASVVVKPRCHIVRETWQALLQAMKIR